MKFTSAIKSLTIPALASLLLSNCASVKWSESQKKSLTSVSLATPKIVEDGYKSAEAVSLATQSRAQSTAMGAGMGGGLIGAAVGELIAGGMTAAEGSDFKSDHAGILAKLDEQMKLPVTSDLATAYTSALKKDSFFSSRFADSSPNRFEVQVAAYGIRRVKGEGEDMFTPYLNTIVTLKTGDGKVVMKPSIIAGSATEQGGTGLPLHRLAQDKKLMRTQWARAVRANAANFQARIQKGHGQ